MTILAYDKVLLGPYTEVMVCKDRLSCDGLDFPFNVIGRYEIILTPPPGPLEQYQWDFERSSYTTRNPSRGAVEAVRAVKRSEVDTAFNAHSTTNFLWDFGSIEAKDDLSVSIGEAGVHNLQIRHIEDQANWTAVHATALAAVVGGQPEAPTPLKTADNLWVQTTAAEVVAVLTVGVEGRPGLLARQSLILARYGALKKQIADAADLAALDAIDLAAGWPS